MKDKEFRKNKEHRERVQTNRYMADVNNGLNRQQVEEYTRNGWTNEPVDPPSKSVQEIIQSNVFTYFNLVFAVLAVLLIVAGSFRNLTFLPVIIANTCIGIFQEIRAKNTLDKLSVLNAPKAVVVRDGQKWEIPAEELVLDDIVLFKAGNQICADAIVVEGEVSANESLLTGESDEITKKPGDLLMSGSFVVSGECYARLDRVGEDSYISKLTLEAKAMNHEEQSEMIRVLDKLVGVVGIIIIPIGVLLFGQQFIFAKASFSKSITSMVAAVIGMIPEGLYLLASVALVVSVMRLASKKVLVHDMKCIETLARVNVLCVDKTGTITENTMEVNGTVPMDGYDKENMPSIKEMLSDFAAGMSSDNITMEAIKNYFNSPSGKKAVSISSFSSEFKYSGAAFDDANYVLGAPEFVLRDDYEKYKEEIENYSSEGYRVLVFGKYDGEINGKELTEKVVPIALVFLSNPIREEAPETFNYFANQGVEIKVISGDNPITVSQVAQQAGITVAMTGDGVNDVLALKDADCSVAMASGSDAAAQASQLVLLDSNFASMPSVVLEGRRVVNNIERSASLFLVKNIFSFLLSLFSVCFMINYPLEPSQVSLISMFTIGIPAFFLALQPNKNIIQGSFLTNVLIKALPAGITDVLVVGALVVFGQVFEVNETDISTACTMLLSIVGFMILYNISKPMNTLRWCVWGGSIIGLLLCSIYLGDLFAIRGMSTKCIMLFVVFAIVTEPMMRYGTMIIEKIGKRITRRIEKRKKEKML